jgi:hypothetical protein
VTFTLPDALRALARAQPKVVYGVLMRAAAAALLTLTADPRYLGGRPGVLAVLHTWTRALLYHPHVHMLVTAGGLRGADQIWVAPRHAAFLVPGRALSRLFRGKVRAALRTAGVLEQVPATLWRHEWVVHVQPAGTGEKVLEYLARYVFRIALVNSRLERFEDGQITFRYREGRTGLLRRCTLDAVAFLDRFLQHVLPPGFTKVRHYGLFSPSRRELLARARAQLLATSATPSPDSAPADPVPISAPASAPLPRCPVCAVGLLHVVEILPRAGARHEPPARHSPRGRFGAPRGAGRGGLSDRRAGRSPPASARRSPPCSTPAVAGREPLTPLRLPLPGSSNGLESPKRAASGQIEFNTAFCLGVARQKALNR